ncbi:hypothetical protein FraEuI1c_4527 [Pseudofrankia inefficax]|uniref:Uncharacterized protein n=1 Tax=Pseudofrankia inefficax (strain DSM 45817 / CECT 9037 / DDB 130130 / EuI1c) TaxID=298654 RepID=E3IVL4_PSEI1|nr:hypothetical protein FraEuI1c_4527 [Pseudofrankia inefficax]
MSAQNGSPPSASPTSTTSPAVLGSQYGTCDGKAALARETSPGSWQVKVHDPKSPLAGHDGWVMIGRDWPSLAEASAATGLS